MRLVSGYSPYEAPSKGYLDKTAPKTDYCSVCSRRRSVLQFRVQWRGFGVCADCEKTHRLVTFRATWTELLPREQVDAVAEGDDFTEVGVKRLWVTRVAEPTPSSHHSRPGVEPILAVHMSDEPPHKPS